MPQPVEAVREAVVHALGDRDWWHGDRMCQEISRSPSPDRESRFTVRAVLRALAAEGTVQAKRNYGGTFYALAGVPVPAWLDPHRPASDETVEGAIRAVFADDWNAAGWVARGAIGWQVRRYLAGLGCPTQDKALTNAISRTLDGLVRRGLLVRRDRFGRLPDFRLAEPLSDWPEPIDTAQGDEEASPIR